MFVKTTNGEASKFPYTLGELRRENPNTSFPKVIPDGTLAQYGVYRVQPTTPPEFNNRTHSLSQSVESLDGIWQQTWVAKQLPESKAVSNQKAYRNQLLAETDFYALTDVTLTAEMTTYRQALRDITTHANWPNLNDDDWPTKP